MGTLLEMEWQGINIFRFANRIPLLFEQGGDVVTRTALKRIKWEDFLSLLATSLLIWYLSPTFFLTNGGGIDNSWNSYKINQTQDKIGVFVSIVSTKIPFKGTGKEYIGDDISEIATAVKVTSDFSTSSSAAC